MYCATELALIEKGLTSVVGVGALDADYLNRRLRVPFDPQRTSANTIAERLREIGFPAEPAPPTDLPVVSAADSRLDRYTLVGGVCLCLGILAWFAGLAAPWLANTFAVVAAVISSVRVARAALRALRLRALDMNVLVIIAASGAIALGEYFEAATTVFLFGVSLWLERHGLDRARSAVRSLVELTPRVAHRLENGVQVDVAPERLAVGERVVVKPGERLPIDGVVATGHSAVNEAAITGESAPVDKRPGDAVYAGAINGQGMLEIDVTRTADNSTLAQVARLVEQAQASRSATERFVDRFARRYTPAVIALAAVVAIAPPLLAGGAWGAWLNRGLVLLVIACPCALVISTPVTIVCGLRRGALRGLLIKGGQHLETAGRIESIAFDKTGTLTTGEPRVERVEPFDGQTENEILALAASLESSSQHPLARAIVEHARDRGLSWPHPEGASAVEGFGVSGVVDGRLLFAGNQRMFEEQRLGGPEAAARFSRPLEAASAARTLAWIGTRERMLGRIELADQPRPDARTAIRELKALGIAPIIMLTGDRRAAAEHIARQLDIDQVEAELLPRDKVDQVARLMHHHPRLAMVGDGVNDSPVLAMSRLGVALGSGASDAAMETADVVIMSPHVARVVELVALGRRTRRLLHQNIALALAIKGATLILAVAGVASMWMAVAADVGASLLVIANGMRLLNEPPRGGDT